MGSEEAHQGRGRRRPGVSGHMQIRKLGGTSPPRKLQETNSILGEFSARPQCSPGPDGEMEQYEVLILTSTISAGKFHPMHYDKKRE